MKKANIILMRNYYDFFFCKTAKFKMNKQRIYTGYDDWSSSTALFQKHTSNYVLKIFSIYLHHRTWFLTFTAPAPKQLSWVHIRKFSTD